MIANLDVDKYRDLAEKNDGFPILKFFPKSNKAGIVESLDALVKEVVAVRDEEKIKGKVVAKKPSTAKRKISGDDDKTRSGGKRRNHGVLQFFDDAADVDGYDDNVVVRAKEQSKVLLPVKEGDGTPERTRSPQLLEVSSPEVMTQPPPTELLRIDSYGDGHRESGYNRPATKLRDSASPTAVHRSFSGGLPWLNIWGVVKEKENGKQKVRMSDLREEVRYALGKSDTERLRQVLTPAASTLVGLIVQTGLEGVESGIMREEMMIGTKMETRKLGSLCVLLG